MEIKESVVRQCGANAAIVLAVLEREMVRGLPIEGSLYVRLSLSEIASKSKCLTKKMVYRAVKILIKNGIIIRKEFTSNDYWYAIGDIQ